MKKVRRTGFTLVELVIVIVIVGVLSIIAVPVYRGYVEKAQITEAKALLTALKTAQDIYYAEHGQYYDVSFSRNYDAVLGIDARANKYYDKFASNETFTNIYRVWAYRKNSTSTDTVALVWKVDPSKPVSAYSGYKLPMFTISINGKTTYSNS